MIFRCQKDENFVVLFSFLSLRERVGKKKLAKEQVWHFYWLSWPAFVCWMFAFPSLFLILIFFKNFENVCVFVNKCVCVCVCVKERERERERERNNVYDYVGVRMCVWYSQLIHVHTLYFKWIFKESIRCPQILHAPL